MNKASELPEITEAIIERQIAWDKQEYGYGSRELALLELEDLRRKGCTLQGVQCTDCNAFQNGHCPMADWQNKHPEFANDELWKKIVAIWKQHEPEEQVENEDECKANAEEKLNQIAWILNVYFKKDVLKSPEHVLNFINDIVLDDVKTKAELEEMMKDILVEEHDFR